MRRAFFVLLALVGLTLPVAAQSSLAGRWHISYVDAALGPVNGWARLDESDGTVFVLYADPRTGEIVPNDGTFTRDGDRLTVLLRGKAPTAASPPPLPGQSVAATAPADVTLTLGDTQVTVPLAPSAAPKSEETRIELRLADDGLSMSGTWIQSVDPVTGRDAKGQGRTGELRLLYDGAGAAEMRGSETWFRPQIAFVTAFPLQDQMAFSYDEAHYPEPFDENGRLKRPLADYRRIFVIGRDLPGSGSGDIAIESDDPLVSYSFHALASDLRHPSSSDAPWLEDAWEMLAARVPPERLAELKRYDVMMLNVKLAPGAKPGPKTFRIEGQEAAWLLQYGDWRGRLSIARPLGFGQTDDTDFIYPQEQVQFEIFMDRDVSATSFAVIPGVVHLDGSTTFGAGTSRLVYLKQDADEPRRYVSDPVVVSDPLYADTYAAGTPMMLAVPGERVVAEFGDDPIVALRPSLDAATVAQSPRHVRAALTGEPRLRGRLWLDVLKTAAACHEIQAADLTTMDEGTAETFEKRIVFAWTKLSKDIALGEHAAAILLRDVFVDLLDAEARGYERDLSDEQVLGFRRMMQDAVWHELSPLGAVRVKLPDGSEDSFAASFLDEFMEERHGLKGEALSAWQLDAARQARILYARAIRRSLEIARETEDCETEELLALTGFDFDAVRHVAKQLLVVLSEEPVAGGSLSRPVWTADRRARAWVDRVAYAAETIADIRNINKDDNDKLLIAAVIVTAPLALLEAPLALTAMLVIDVTDAVITAGRTIATQFELNAEVTFATGAAAIIGTGRYDAAEARKYEWVEGFLMTMAAAGGAAYSGFELYEGVLTLAQKEAIREGRELVERVTLETLGQYSRKNLQSLSQAIRRAGAIAARAGRAALDPVERKLMALADAIERLRFPPPEWAARLSPETWVRIEPIARLPHIDRFFREAPERIAHLLDSAEGFDLAWNPWASLDEFEAAVTRAQGKTEPLGSDFFAQAAPGRNPQGIVLADSMEAVEGGQKITLRVNSGRDNAEVAAFERARTADTAFDTGGDILELRYAKIEQGIDEALRMVPGLTPTLTPRGTPLALYLNMRAMQNLGFAYADPRLSVVKLSTVVNVNTCVQMTAMRRAMRNATLEEMAEHTFSYRYTRDFLEQAGYEVEGVIKVRENAWRGTPEGYAESGFFAGSARVPRGTPAAEAEAIRAQELIEFAQRHGVRPNETIEFGYDIYIRVRPRGQ